MTTAKIAPKNFLDFTRNKFHPSMALNSEENREKNVANAITSAP